LAGLFHQSATSVPAPGVLPRPDKEFPQFSIRQKKSRNFHHSSPLVATPSHFKPFSTAHSRYEGSIPFTRSNINFTQ
jgi:hypothetical protein